MSVYAVGDVQGCHVALQKLLDKIQFDTTRDRILFVGDLVNRGPDSVGTLRLIRSLGESAAMVLGNHDLNTLAVAAGVRDYKSRDTIADVIQAPDAAELLDWLRHQPLLIEEQSAVVVHAGIYPLWSLKKARSRAHEVETALQGPDHSAVLEHMYGMQPDIWRDELKGFERLRFIINCFTRMRYIDRHGHLDFQHAGAPGSQPQHLKPWFEFPGRQPLKKPVVFGHWSTLGLLQKHGVISLDTGCVWGQQLTAIKLKGEVSEITSIPCF